MNVDLYCPNCTHTLREGAPEPIDDLLECGLPLGDGQTFEDLLHAELQDRNPMACPSCGVTVAFGDEDLNRLAMDLLARW